MAFRHGVYKSEVPTSLISPVEGLAGLPVVIGTAPVYMAEAGNVNKPVLCYSYSEAVQALGYVRDWENYTLCEFMYSHFALYAQSPCVLINVFDPAKHKEAVSSKEYEVVGGEVKLGADVIISAGISVSASGVDYEANYDDNGEAILTLRGNNIPGKVRVSFTKARPDQVSSSEIIGGVDGNTGEYKGLELVSKVFTKYRLVPGLIVAPKWSEKPEVAAIMRAKCTNINGLFSCISLVDIPSDTGGAEVYSQAPEWKNRNNYMSERQIVCWPKVKLGDDIYHLSTQLAGVINSVDSSHDDVPYKSPSNESLQMTACVNASGKEIDLGLEEANYLNSQGIVTPLNFMSGWVSWGNRTGVYPSATDPKDMWISIRRMFDWVGNTFIQTFWQKTDEPMTPRLIRTIVDTFNIYLNGLQARERLLGGRIEFQEQENVLTDLMNGILKFHVFMTPPPPAEVIEGIFEFDTSYLNTLMEAMG